MQNRLACSARKGGDIQTQPCSSQRTSGKVLGDAGQSDDSVHSTGLLFPIKNRSILSLLIQYLAGAGGEYVSKESHPP